MFLVLPYLERSKHCNPTCTGNLPLLTQPYLLIHVTHQNKNTKIKFIKNTKDKEISIVENILYNNSTSLTKTNLIKYQKPWKKK